ncbi:uncharacterized protein LOC143865815 [Tasmannia lanceolata]|uniref:uncharacterized protein LOC143865815 n=1 Tax=Tasmannia lanceolata TaxID=3420 RepID=UPI0040648BE7
MDGTNLRGKNPCVLLIACGMDGNNGIFPFAYAIVEKENIETWSWFLCQLRVRVCQPHRRTGITFVSDRQKGIIQVVNDVFPESYHSYSIRHIQANIKEYFKDEYVEEQFWKAATTLREDIFRMTMADIEQPIKKHMNGYARLLRKIGLVSNVVLKNAKEYPIAILVEHTRWKASESFAKRREASNGWKGPLTSHAIKTIQLASEKGRRMNVSALDSLLFQVSSKYHQDRVDLREKTCSCRAFQTFGIAGAHAMTATGFRKADVLDFTEEWYRSETLRDTYNEVIDTTLDKLQWQQPEARLLPIDPPKFERLPGRPKKKRKESTFNSGIHNRCGNCGQLGHNKQRCGNKPIRRPVVDVDRLLHSRPLARSEILRQPPFYS